MTVTGGDDLVSGQIGSISCTTDVVLNGSTLEWLEINEWDTTTLVVSFDQEAVLHFNPVTLDMHGTQYMCRQTVRYGVQERIIVANVQSKSDSLMVLIP